MRAWAQSLPLHFLRSHFESHFYLLPHSTLIRLTSGVQVAVTDTFPLSFGWLLSSMQHSAMSCRKHSSPLLLELWYSASPLSLSLSNSPPLCHSMRQPLGSCFISFSIQKCDTPPLTISKNASETKALLKLIVFSPLISLAPCSLDYKVAHGL